MRPGLTADAAMWYDSRLREGLADIVGTPIPDLAWLISSLPPSIGGLGLTSAFATRSAAHYASWASSWHSISRMFPSAIPLAAADLATSPLPFAHGIRTAHAAVDSALTAVTDNTNQYPLAAMHLRIFGSGSFWKWPQSAVSLVRQLVKAQGPVPLN